MEQELPTHLEQELPTHLEQELPTHLEHPSSSPVFIMGFVLLDLSCSVYFFLLLFVFVLFILT